MGSMIDFGQPAQEILQNTNSKPILKTQKLEILSPLFEIFLKKYPVFWTLNEYISRTVNATALNEAILKSSH